MMNEIKKRIFHLFIHSFAFSKNYLMNINEVFICRGTVSDVGGKIITLDTVPIF